jgi:hypothetical protein
MGDRSAIIDTGRRDRRGAPMGDAAGGFPFPSGSSMVLPDAQPDAPRLGWWPSTKARPGFPANGIGDAAYILHPAGTSIIDKFQLIDVDRGGGARRLRAKTVGGVGSGAYPALMPAAVSTGVQRASSSRTKFAASSGPESSSGSNPSSISFCWKATLRRMSRLGVVKLGDDLVVKLGSHASPNDYLVVPNTPRAYFGILGKPRHGPNWRFFGGSFQRDGP